jgi:hypothetical protein
MRVALSQKWFTENGNIPEDDTEICQIPAYDKPESQKKDLMKPES